MRDLRFYVPMHRHSAPARPAGRVSAWLVFAVLALGPSACTIANRHAEMLGPVDEASDAGSDAGSSKGEDTAPAAMRVAGSSGSQAVAAASGSGGESGASRSGAAGSSGTATSDAGRAGSSGIPADTPDAGGPESSNDAEAEDAAQVDDVTCAFELSECLLLDPLNFETCLDMNMKRCDLLAADGGAPPAPSPACSMQTAECIMRTPDQAQGCLDMQKSCTL